MSLFARFKHAYSTRRAVRWPLEAFGFFALISLVGLWQTRSLPRGPAPDFTLSRLADGAQVSRSQLAGKPTLLVFWAPWCSVCKAESGNVSLVQKLVGAHANVVSVATAFRSVDDVRGYVTKQQVDYPVLLAPEATTAQFHVEAFPTAFFLDDQGQIRHAVVGYTTTAGMLWRLFAP